MKKIYLHIKKMIVTRYKFMFFIATFLFIVSVISILYHHLPLVASAFFAASLAGLIRLITYKTGKIPFFAIDKTWNGIEWRKRKELTDEDKAELYEKMSLKLAAIHLEVAIVALCAWIICEFLAFLVV